jgi:hypothetical protein
VNETQIPQSKMDLIPKKGAGGEFMASGVVATLRRFRRACTNHHHQFRIVSMTIVVTAISASLIITLLTC